MSQWRDVTFDEQHGGPGQWFLLCKSCPIHALKVEATGRDKALACMGGPRDGDRLGVFAVCWHTDKMAVRKQDGQWQVECRFNPETDLWNHPGGKIGAPPPSGLPIDVTLLYQRVLEERVLEDDHECDDEQ